MGLIQEFKDFAMKGNVVDMSVGVIMGAAFGKIVSSLTDKVLMPPIGYLVGGVDFTSLKMQLGGDDKATIKFGDFLQTCFDFLIIAFCVFMLVKAMNHAMLKQKQAETAAPPEPPADVKLLTEIRDLLKSR